MSTFSNIDPATAKPWLHVPGDWRRPRAEGEFDLLWDATRAYGQLWPRPTPEDVAAYYHLDDYYTHRKGHRGPASNRSFAQRLMDKFAWLADGGVDPDKTWWSGVLGDRKRRILEIGCGNGSNLSVLASLGHDVRGVDPDPQALSAARKNGHRVWEGTAEALPAEILDERFDAIIFMHVLEHCVDPFQALRNAGHLLADGGQVIAEVPNNACIGGRRFGAFWYWLDVPRHLNFFTAQSLASLFQSVEIEVANISYRGYCRQFSHDWKAVQKHISDVLGTGRDGYIREWRYWAYLAESAGARKGRKYDSVRIVGKLPSRG